MKPFLLCTLLLPCTILYAQDAREIVRKADEHARGASSVAEMTIVTTRPAWTRSLELKAWSKGTQYAVILIQSPAKEKGTVFLKRKKEVWNWLPALERTIKLPPSMMSQSWMGTDFTNDDLVKESSIVDDYDHQLIGKESVADRECYKIQLVPKPNAAVVWGKILAWIDTRNYMQLRTEFYDENGALAQTMTGSEIKTFSNRMLPSHIEMVPAGKKGQKTAIIYRSLEFDKALEDRFFSTENITKIKG
jgi:outer membrane lipoprotein-sorting protein